MFSYLHTIPFAQLQPSMSREASELREVAAMSFMVAIKNEDVEGVRRCIHADVEKHRKSYMLMDQSSKEEFEFRTPLMAAADTGKYDMFDIIMRAFTRCMQSYQVRSMSCHTPEMYYR